MKLLRLLPLFIALLPAAAFAGSVASVNFKALADDLRDHYLAKPENAELREQLAAVTAQEKEQQQALTKAITEQNQIDLRTTMEASRKVSDRIELRRKIDTALKKELYLIISDMGLAYDLIYDSSNTEAVLFAKTGVDDVTVLVKQSLVKTSKAQ